MKLKQLGANKTEIELPETETRVNRRVLFSYETPVAYAETGPEGREYFVTSEHYSRTTSKHISQWLPREMTEEKPQSFFDELVK